MDDLLFDAAKYYSEHLKSKKFKLVAGKKGETIELIIVFTIEHFKHLAGLHKLKDIPSIQKKSGIILQQILEGKTTYNDISQSDYIEEIYDRLFSLPEITEVLVNSKLLLKSNGEFKGIKADYMLTKLDSHGYNLHLFLKNNINCVADPVSFFRRKDTKYLSTNAGYWTVLNIEEIFTI